MVEGYIFRTKIDQEVRSLFVNFREPFSAAPRDTFSRWIVGTISSAGADAFIADTARPKDHDTRSINTSWALFHGSPVEDILGAAFGALLSPLLPFI